MTTLLQSKTSDSDRRCDAKCYDAKAPECDCLCGGKNHGAGLRQALENARNEWLTKDVQGTMVAAGLLADLGGPLFAREGADRIVSRGTLGVGPDFPPLPRDPGPVRSDGSAHSIL